MLVVDNPVWCCSVQRPQNQLLFFGPRLLFLFASLSDFAGLHREAFHHLGEVFLFRGRGELLLILLIVSVKSSYPGSISHWFIGRRLTVRVVILTNHLIVAFTRVHRLNLQSVFAVGHSQYDFIGCYFVAASHLFQCFRVGS